MKVKENLKSEITNLNASIFFQFFPNFFKFPPLLIFPCPSLRTQHFHYSISISKSTIPLISYHTISPLLPSPLPFPPFNEFRGPSRPFQFFALSLLFSFSPPMKAKRGAAVFHRHQLSCPNGFAALLLMVCKTTT